MKDNLPTGTLRLSKYLFSIFAIITIILSLMQPAIKVQAAAKLSISPITWNIIGLDSNKVDEGPNLFPVGARVCNTGDEPATNVTSTFVWDSADPYINLRPGSLTSYTGVMALASLAPNACFDFYYEVEITRDPAAYEHTRRYHITAASAETDPVSTPIPREVYVEHLISQNRNSVQDVRIGEDGSVPNVSIPSGGSMNLLVGNTYNIQLIGGTATNGYNELEDFINLPNTSFRINSISSTYTVTSLPAPHDYFYADSCQWYNDPTKPTYRTCANRHDKTGGDVTTTYNVTIIGEPGSSQTLSTLIYDFSGSSYHYNSDFSASVRYITLTKPDFKKAFSPKTMLAGEISRVTFTIYNPSSLPISGVSFSDPLPGTPGQMVVADPPNVSVEGCGSPAISAAAGSKEIALTNASIKVGGTCTLSVDVTASGSGTYVNITNPLFINGKDTGLTARDDLVVTTPPKADLAVTKTDGVTSVTSNSSTTYTVRVTNNGPDAVSGARLVDGVGAGLSATAVVCSTALNNQCVSAPALSDLTGAGISLPTLAPGQFYEVRLTATVTAASGSVTNTATVTPPAGTTDTDPTNNTASDTDTIPANPQADLMVTKTDGVTSVTSNSSTIYTVRVTNNGPDAVTAARLVDGVGAGLSATAVVCSTALNNQCVSAPALSDLTGAGISLPTLASGQFYEVRLTATVTAASGSVTNTADTSVPSGFSDPTPGNNHAEDTDTISLYKLYLVIFKGEPPPTTTSVDMVIGYEDLPFASENDYDYNDWTVALESQLTYRSTDLLQKVLINFVPRARGGTFNHSFKFRIPAQTFSSNGTTVINIYDQNHNLISTQTIPFTSSSDTTYTIFPQTIEVFPGYIDNTIEGGSADPAQRFADLTITFDVPFSFTVNQNWHEHGVNLFFDPVLSVINTGDEIHRGDGRLLVIPTMNWLWPEEAIRIDWAYPMATYLPGLPPDFIFPANWWTVYNHCVYDGFPCNP